MRASAGMLRTHVDYTAWASQRLVSAARELPPEHLNHDFGTADRSVLGTLVHIFAADRVWLPRLTGGSVPGFVSDADYSMAVLERDWPALHDRWRQWMRDLRDEDVETDVRYKDLKGNEWRQPLWQLVLHVVNHGTHHRGQVSGFLRSLGYTPPKIDLVYYCREMG